MVGTKATRPRIVEPPRKLGAGLNDVHASYAWPRLKNSRRARIAGDAREQHLEMRRVVDEVEALAVDDEQRRLVVLVEEARVGVGQAREVLVGDRLLEARRRALCTRASSVSTGACR